MGHRKRDNYIVHTLSPDLSFQHGVRNFFGARELRGG